MAGDNAGLDQNSRSSLLGVSSVDGVSTVKVYADPITHRLLVDVSGIITISGLGQEVPTGTVNGVNTTFTVQNNPVFGEVSGQVMVSSVENPANFGYTISGTGPYTLTYVNAPTQAPDSFYNLASAGVAISSYFETDSFVATNNQSVFTTTKTPLFVFSVIVQGQVQVLNVDYTQAGNVFTLTSGVPSGTYIEIQYIHS